MQKDLETILVKLLVYFIIISIVNLFMMLIWNTLMPQLFGLKEIGYFQLLGIHAICNYFFKPIKIEDF